MKKIIKIVEEFIVKDEQVIAETPENEFAREKINFVLGEILEKIEKAELYTPEEILQAMTAVFMKEGKIYMDLVLSELKKNKNA